MGCGGTGVEGGADVGNGTGATTPGIFSIIFNILIPVIKLASFVVCTNNCLAFSVEGSVVPPLERFNCLKMELILRSATGSTITNMMVVPVIICCN